MTAEHAGMLPQEPESNLPVGASIARKMSPLTSCNVTFVRPQPTKRTPAKAIGSVQADDQEFSFSGSCSASQGVSGPPSRRMKVLGATPGSSGVAIDSARCG
jgi:hypothetical protein